MNKLVAVTGANGFVGSHVIEYLAAAGYRMRGVVRSESAILPPGVERVVVPDYFDGSGLADAFCGADAVLHLAGRAHAPIEDDSRPEFSFHRVNVQLTERVLNEAIDSGVPHFVFASSIAAVCTSSAAVVTDATPPSPTTSYGMSKLNAEHLVNERGRTAGITTTILRPSLMYGPRMAGNPLMLFDAVARRRILPVGALQNRRSFTYVENVAAGIEAALRNANRAGGTFAITDGVALSTPEFVRRIASALGTRPRILTVPLRLLSAVAAAGSILRPLISLPLTSDQLDRIAGSIEIDSSRYWRTVDAVPPIALPSGLQKTAAWILKKSA